MFCSGKGNTFPDWQPLSRSTSLPSVLIWSFVFLVAVKLVLTSQEEIIAFYLPHDDLWQIQAAGRAYWGAKYAPNRLYHLPVFPLFMECLRLIGLPLRLALEIFYCGSACFLTAVLWRVGAPVAMTILAAVALIFHPASFQLPNRCHAEIMLAPLMMGAVASTLYWWIARNRSDAWRYAVHAAIWWGLAWNVRKESIVIIPVFLALLGFGLFAERKAGWRRVIVGVAIILCFCLATETAIKGVNWLRWGLFATSLQTAPGYRSAIKSLQSIRPDPPLDYIPVPAEVRKRAYAVSPAFAKLEPYLEGEVARGWAMHSKPFADSKGLIGLGEYEIAAGWFYWAFYDAVVAAGYGSDPAEADRFLAQIGTEVNAAISDGRLPGRWTPLAMMDPAWARWLPRLPESLHRVGGTFGRPAVGVRPPYDRAVEEAYGQDFDKIANRRAHLTALRYGKAEIHGWTSASDGFVQAVKILSPDGSLLGQASLDIPRPDIDSNRSVGFRVPMVVPSEGSWQQAEVNIVLGDGSVARRSLASIPMAQRVDIPLEKALVHFTVTQVEKPKFRKNLWKAQTYVEAWYLTLQSWLLWPGVLAAFAVVPIVVVQRRPIDLALVVIVVAVATRVLFFAILDASAWPGDQPRYLYAVYPLFILAVMLVFMRALAVVDLICKSDDRK